VPKPSAERVDIGRYARQAVANGWIVLLAVAAIGGAAYVHAKSQHPVYAASAVVRVFDPNDASVGGSTQSVNVDPAREVADQVLYARSPGLWAAVTRRIGADTARSIGTHSVLGSANSDTIQLTTESTSRANARRATEAYVDVYLEQRRNAIAKRYDAQAAALHRQADDTQARIDLVDARIAALDPSGSTLDTRQNLDLERQALATKQATLLANANQAEVAKLARQQTMDVVQAADLPGSPVRPAPVRDATVGCALGLLVGLALVALRLRSRDRLSTSEDLAAELQGLPFVTSIPFRRRRLRRRRGVYALDIVDGPNEVREAYRALRANLILGDLDDPIRSLLVTSAREHEGKTTIAANVALSLAQAGERVVVVDCDLRTPALHEQFGIANDVGLSSLLTAPGTPCDALRQVQLNGTTITVLPAGPPPPDPADLFLGLHAAQAIRTLTEKFRYVVLDCPPILSFADAMTLPWLVDGVLFVARADRTKAVDVKHAELRLRQVSAPLLGAVLVGPHADRVAAPIDVDASEGRSSGAPHASNANGPGTNDSVIDNSVTNAAPTNGSGTNGASVHAHPTLRPAELVLDE
jgi:capsular exopolysaccharide synthesis family protein